MKKSHEPTIKAFLPLSDREELTRAVVAAEKTTSGEIRVLLVKRCTPRFPVPDFNVDAAVNARAEQEFMKLGIQQTTGKTGVLLMVALHERKVVIKADQSINEKVGPDTWETAVELAVSRIKKGNQKDGLCMAVKFLGRVLAEHFPRQEDDQNELPDEIVIKD